MLHVHVHVFLLFPDEIVGGKQDYPRRIAKVHDMYIFSHGIHVSYTVRAVSLIFEVHVPTGKWKK